VIIQLSVLSICLSGADKKQNILGHEDGGDKHPVHEKCLKQWLKIFPSCPTCGTYVNINSVYSIKDRVIDEIKISLLGTIEGFAVGTVIGTLEAVLSGTYSRMLTGCILEC